jgi:hypothetical protein
LEPRAVDEPNREDISVIRSFKIPREKARVHWKLLVIVATLALGWSGGPVPDNGLSAIHAAGPRVQEPYAISLYPHWMDEDGDCQDTRDEVLMAESLVPVVFDADLCAVVSGLWYDPFVGSLVTDADSMDVDHFIPLPEVHRSGGNTWSPQKRRQYANDLTDSSTLIAVSRSSNQSRSDSGPDTWMPINREFRCLYVTTWIQVKRRWGLTITDAEMDAVRFTLEGCRSR